MTDLIFTSWARANVQEMEHLAANSSIVRIIEQQGAPPRKFILAFETTSVVQSREQVRVHQGRFVVGVNFATNHLKWVNPAELLTWLGPSEVFHPNIAPPFICLGTIAPGTTLCFLAYRLYDLIRYARYAPHDGLNPAACQWARNHQELFPLDRRPLLAGRYANVRQA